METVSETVDLTPVIDLITDRTSIMINLMSVEIIVAAVAVGVILAFVLWRFLK